MQRRSLPDEIYQTVARQLFSATLEPGTRIRDAQIAAKLGVSRTPVREALFRLHREGLVDHDVGRGFRVRPLSLEEAESTYPILWTLEALALRLSAPAVFTEGRIAELDQLAAAIESTPSASRRIVLDNEWHRLLLSGCGNRRLLRMITEVKTVVRRYELRYMTFPDLVHHSKTGHLAISEMAPRDTVRASVLLETHWCSALDLLRERITEAPTP